MHMAVLELHVQPHMVPTALELAMVASVEKLADASVRSPQICVCTYVHLHSYNSKKN